MNYLKKNLVVFLCKFCNISIFIAICLLLACSSNIKKDKDLNKFIFNIIKAKDTLNIMIYKDSLMNIELKSGEKIFKQINTCLLDMTPPNDSNILIFNDIEKYETQPYYFLNDSILLFSLDRNMGGVAIFVLNIKDSLSFKLLENKYSECNKLIHTGGSWCFSTYNNYLLWTSSLYYEEKVEKIIPFRYIYYTRLTDAGLILNEYKLYEKSFKGDILLNNIMDYKYLWESMSDMLK